MAYPDLINMIQTLSLDSGSVSAPAAVGTSLLVDTTQKWGINQYKNCIVKIIGGTGVGQLALVTSNGATSLQVSPPWILGLDTSSIYVIYKPEISNELETILSLVQDPVVGLAALRALLDILNGKVAGAAPVSNVVAANWQSGTGTSGETGANLVTLGASGTRNKLHSLLVNISALTAGAKITVKIFMKVNGTERKVYSQQFTQGTDPNGLWIVNGTVGIHEALRVEVQSDTAGDNGRNIDYDYMLEVM